MSLCRWDHTRQRARRELRIEGLDAGGQMSRESVVCRSRIVAVIPLVLMCVGLESAQTPQPPSSPPVVVSQQPPAPTTDPSSSAAPATDNRAPVTVNVFPVDQRAESAQSSDWKEWLPNFIIAFFALTSFIVAVAQGLISKRQADIADRQSKILDAQSAIMAGPPKIIVREIDVPEMIHVRTIARTPPEGRTRAIAAEVERQSETTGDVMAPRKLSGSFRMTNKGNRAARTELIEALLWVGETLPQTNPVLGHKLDQQQVTMPAGNTTRLDFRPLTLTDDQEIEIRLGRAHLFALGKIVYRDELGNVRRTGFARGFNIEKGRFEMLKDEPDYEYVD
jgi:hypothetical protein